MGLLKNIINKCRQAKKKADEATTDHVANAEVSLEDGKKQLTAIETQLHDLRAKALGATRKRDEAQEKVDKIKGLIERVAAKGQSAKGQALTAIKDQLQTLIQERDQAETELVSTQAVVDANQDAITKVTASRDDIKGKLRGGESKLAAQKAKLAAAKTTQAINQSVTTFGGSSFMDDLTALDEKVQGEEDKAQIATEMTGEKSEASLASIEASLDSQSADDEIAALLAGSPSKSKK